MKTIYIDFEFKCHTVSDGTMMEIHTDFFDGKCDAFIEGYRYIPSGEIWTRSDGRVFYGEMVAPWKDYAELSAAQYEYEKQRLLEYETKEIELNNIYNEGINSI